MDHGTLAWLGYCAREKDFVRTVVEKARKRVTQNTMQNCTLVLGIRKLHITSG